MRRIFRSIPLICLAAIGCASTGPSRPSLEPLLPETEPENVRFFHGSWIWPDSIYAFHLTQSGIYVADPAISELEARAVAANDCPKLGQAYRDVVVSIVESAKIAADESDVDGPDEVVLDGPNFRLEYWSGKASTTMVLTGDRNAQLVTPWIDSAYRVRAIADDCIRKP